MATDRNVTDLAAIPHVDAATARALDLLGIKGRLHLAAQEPALLAARLRQLVGRDPAPELQDRLAAAVEYCRTGRVRPLWHHARVRQELGPRDAQA